MSHFRRKAVYIKSQYLRIPVRPIQWNVRIPCQLALFFSAKWGYIYQANLLEVEHAHPDRSPKHDLLYQQIKEYLRQGILSGSCSGYSSSSQPAARAGSWREPNHRGECLRRAGGRRADPLRLGSGTYVLVPDPLLPLPRNDTEAPWPLWQQSLQEHRSIVRSKQTKMKPARHPQPISFASGIGMRICFRPKSFAKYFNL